MAPTETFDTERLHMRAWTHADAERHLDIYSRDEVTRWLGGSRTFEGLEDSIASIDRWNSLADGRLGVWAAQVRASGVIAGTVLLVSIPFSGEEAGRPPEQGGDVEVGWHLHPDCWGRGYASEAARALLARGFDASLEEIVAVTNLDNYASQAVCRRIGMEHVGRTDRYYGRELELFVARRP